MGYVKHIAHWTLKNLLKQSLYVLYSLILCSSVFTSITHPGNPEFLQPLSDLNDCVFCFWLTGRWSGTRPGWCWRESQLWWPVCQSSLPQGWQSWSERLTSGGSHWSLHPDGQWCSQWAAQEEKKKRRENSMFDTKTKKSSKGRWIKTNVLKKTTNTTATSKNNNDNKQNVFFETWQVSSHANIRATMNLAPALEDAVDIFVPNILWMSLFGVKLDTWMTPPDQCEDMLCFPFVVYYVRSMWEHSTVFGRYYFPSQNWQSHQNLNQQSGELYMGKISILGDISILLSRDGTHIIWNG